MQSFHVISRVYVHFLLSYFKKISNIFKEQQDVQWKVLLPLIECPAATHYQFIVNSSRHTLCILREIYAYANLPCAKMYNVFCNQISQCFLSNDLCVDFIYSKIIEKNSWYQLIYELFFILKCLILESDVRSWFSLIFFRSLFLFLYQSIILLFIWNVPRITDFSLWFRLGLLLNFMCFHSNLSIHVYHHSFYDLCIIEMLSTCSRIVSCYLPVSCFLPVPELFWQFLFLYFSI